MGRRSETGGVKPAGDRIEVRFTWQGRELRPTLALKPTAANLKHAKRLREEIVREIALGTFILARYFPDYRFLSKVEGDTSPAASRSFADWATTWAELAARSLEHSSLEVYKRHLAAYWTSAWGTLHPQQITHEMVLKRLAELASDRMDESTGKVLKALSRKSQNNIMIPLRHVFELACKEIGCRNPTDGIDNLKVQTALPDPLSAEEVEVILADLREHESPEMADWFEFSCFAGLRIGEQLALRWQSVDLRQLTVLVREARVLGRDKARTKTAVERLVELNARAARVLERQRARTQLQKHGRVFATPGQPEKPWHDEQLQWRAWNASLRRCGVRYRAPKECRDTSVTLALQAGADPVWVARQHGHSIQVMMRDYAGFIPRADRGRNLAAVNRALAEQAPTANSAVEAQ
ncbi:Arm DNA-binding domain-containing protein [Eleftheria terrae]|uniref:Arm DNA-binding domain-containing protein n=1 Tax=Eleftheria terrae TaxID=1597781 RepID=UPI00263BA020|nr:DUF3596 domain-containing protein [Eleftheria terrae]WKB52285.1 site-specific integrase [Eleftheria terrae]